MESDSGLGGVEFRKSIAGRLREMVLFYGSSTRTKRSEYCG